MSLRGRVIVGLVAVGLVAVAGTAAGSMVLVWRTLDQGLESKAAWLRKGPDRVARDARDRISRTLDSVRADPVRVDPRFVETVDVLEILEDDGTILSSRHWPERIGIPVPEPLRWVETTTPAVRLVEVASPGGDRLAAVSGTRVSVGARTIALVAGVFVDETLLGKASPEEIAAVVDERGGILAATPNWPVGLGTMDIRALFPRYRMYESAHSDAPVWFVERSGQRAWIGSGVEFARTSGEDELGTYLVALADATETWQLKRRLAWWFGGVAAIVFVLAAVVGVWISRAVTRPLDEMVRAVEAVSRGEEDYSFAVPNRGELGEYVESFSRMTRALEYERGRLRAVERVAAWREAARRVAHEVKNPLAPIRLSVENLVKARERAPERFDAMFEEATAAILEEVERLKKIVTEFSEYARLPEPRPTAGDLDEVVDSVVSLYASNEDVNVKRERGRGIPPFPFDSDLIAQAVKNVLSNAVEAGGGSVTVRTAEEEGLAVVEVSDDGPGFPEEERAHIFDPYFTTKSGGTGLGLAITSRIVTEHGGLLAAENRPEGGARVTVRLPLERPVPRGEDRS